MSAAIAPAGPKPMSAETASSIRDFFLPVIVAEHSNTRGVINSVPNGKLDFRATAGGKSNSEFMWYLVQAEHNALSGICAGKFEPLPQTPETTGAADILAWDAAQFPQALQRLADLSGEDLLKPVEFAGMVLPAVEYLPLYLGLIQQFRGQLVLSLAVAGKPGGKESGTGELTPEELAEVVGGVTVIGYYGGPSPIQNNTQATLTTALTGNYNPTVMTVGSIMVGAAFAAVGVVTGGAGIAAAVANASTMAAVAGGSATAYMATNTAMTVGTVTTVAGGAVSGGTAAGRK